jgi:hypothetical protein
MTPMGMLGTSTEPVSVGWEPAAVLSLPLSHAALR